MKRIFLLIAALLITASAASPTATKQLWTAGWDNFTEPLKYTSSYVSWSVNTTTRKLSVTFRLVGARPSKLYEVALNFYCTTFPTTFGQFFNQQGGGNCVSVTRQGVTKTVADVVVGVVTTDIHGNGSFTVAIGPIASGTYDLEFYVMDGAGCGMTGGAGNGSDCAADFQSPGPFGTGTTITIP